MFTVPHLGGGIMDVCLCSCFLFQKFAPTVFPIESLCYVHEESP